MKPIHLSPPHMSGRELKFVLKAFAENWIAPQGPDLRKFEREFAKAVGVPHAAALSSGTAALHLALRILGLERGEEVVCSTFTFAASTNAIVYEGGVPVLIDCDTASWNMDPGLLRGELAACARRGKLPRAVVVVDLYGQCADYDPILAACEEYGVPVVEDAAEALGATYWGEAKVKVEVKVEVKEKEPGSAPVSTSASTPTSARFAGSFGKCAAFSFNGNKVITTGGGGMLVSHDKAIVEKARFLATQAKDKSPYYQHSEVGFNYRMSNVLAAIGRGQLPVLSERIAARRRNFEFYQHALGELPGIEFMPEAPFGRCTRWLTCLTVGGQRTGDGRRKARRAGPRSSVLSLVQALKKENIEARPVWKPMHLQPVFRDCRVRGGGVSEQLFGQGICLPSGSALTEQDLERICGVVKKVHETSRSRTRNLRTAFPGSD